jgi:hypothetical protein
MINWAYVAGFFDGEGTLITDVGSSRIRPKIVFYQGKRAVLELIEEFFKGHGITSSIKEVDMGKYKAPRGAKKNKPQFRLLVFRRRSVEKLLKFMLPFLIVKEPGAQDCLRFIKMYAKKSRYVAIKLAWETRRKNGWVRKK